RSQGSSPTTRGSLRWAAIPSTSTPSTETAQTVAPVMITPNAMSISHSLPEVWSGSSSPGDARPVSVPSSPDEPEASATRQLDPLPARPSVWLWSAGPTRSSEADRVMQDCAPEDALKNLINQEKVHTGFT